MHKNTHTHTHKHTVTHTQLMQCNEAFYLFSPERTDERLFTIPMTNTLRETGLGQFQTFPLPSVPGSNERGGGETKKGLLQKHLDIVGIKLEKKNEIIMKFANRSDGEREKE